MEPKDLDDRKIVREVLFAGILGFVILMVFLDFTVKNKARIVQQNATYVQDSTKQAAERIEDVLTAAVDSVETMAHLYGDLMGSPKIDGQRLKEMREHSLFDQIGFIDQNGLETDDSGRTSDVRELESYIKGMKGELGVFAMSPSENEGEALLVFYAPMRCQGEIVGVLQGVYREERIKELLYAEYFGTQAKNYLCKSDGTVIVSVGAENTPEDLLERFPDTMRVSEEEYGKIKKAFQEHAAFGYQYDGTQGTGNAYLTGIPNSDLMLIQTFPSAVTNAMTHHANEVGIALEVKLIVAFGVYIMCLLLTRRKVKKRLEAEKQEMSQIVAAVTQLFERFVVLDLGKDTYRYLKSRDVGLPTEGSYQEMVAYFSPRYVNDESGMDMAHVLEKEYIRACLGKKTPYLQFEYQIQRECPKWENMSLLCLKRKADAPDVVLLAIQDITTLKEKEIRSRTALKEAFEAADAANHAKSDFLSHMSHDIRTPMNAIMGMTAVAAMHIDDKERLVDCLNKITLSSRHLLALINDVLDMSKIESGKIALSMEGFQISQTVEGLLAIMHPQIEAKKQELKVSITDIAHESVFGDPLRLQQVFVNIMGNSVKFTPEGGTISFRIHEKPSHIQGSGCYEFIFEDTGMGMSPEFIQKIYEPFAREESAGKQKIEGTGLGMSIARNIVRMMNGDIQIESTPGEGSRFTVMVYLELQDGEEESTEHLKDLRVLVADDEPDACQNTCEVLDSIGMQADGVYSGDEAILKVEEAYEGADEYAVIILDWKMPGKNGVETTKELRKKLGSEVPIIILSAYDWSAIEQEAREAGVDAFIAKPLFRSRLIYVLNSVVGQQKGEEKISDLEQFEQSDHTGKRVLLVEDNELNREIAVELLDSIGICVEEAHDGQQAVDMLLSRPEHYYDLVFMDIQMPVKNGYEAAKEIRRAAREDLKTIPIVAMSADAFSDDIQKAAVAGMNDHVAKPIELPKLLAALEKWIG